MTTQEPASLVSCLDRARQDLQPYPFTHLATVVRSIRDVCVGEEGAETQRGPFKLTDLHPPPTEGRAQCNLAVLESAQRWLSEARSLAEASLAPAQWSGQVVAGIDSLTQHIAQESARHSATITRLRVAAELRKLADDIARWLSALPHRSWSTRLDVAAEFLVIGWVPDYAAASLDANERNEINGDVSATERHLLETLRSALERLLAPVPDVAPSHYEELVRRNPCRPSVDDALLARVIGGLAWLLRAVQGLLEPEAHAPATAPTSHAAPHPAGAPSGGGVAVAAVDSRAEVLSALARAGKDLAACALDACADAVDDLSVSIVAGAEPSLEQVASEYIAPDASLELLVANRAALDSAADRMSEAWRMVGRGVPQFPFAGAVMERMNGLCNHLQVQAQGYSAAIDRRRVADELAKVGADAALYAQHGVSRLLCAASDLLLGKPVIAGERFWLNDAPLSLTARRFFQTVERLLTRLLKNNTNGTTPYRNLLAELPHVDGVQVVVVVDGLWRLLEHARTASRWEPAPDEAPAQGAAPTQPAPEEPQAETPAPTTDAPADADALCALEAARDHAYLALRLNMDADVFRPVLAGAIEKARGEIARAQRMIAPVGVTDTTPRELDAAHATTPEWALTNAHAALLSWLTRPVGHTPARSAILLAARALRDACEEAYRTRSQETCEAPAPEELTHNQRAALSRGLHALAEAYAYACEARQFGEQEQSADGASLEAVRAEVWEAHDLVRRLLERDRTHLAVPAEMVLTARARSATRALVLAHEGLTKWLDSITPRFPTLGDLLRDDVPQEVLQAVHRALLSVDRLIVGRTAYPPATQARRFLGRTLTRLARWVRP